MHALSGAGSLAIEEVGRQFGGIPGIDPADEHRECALGRAAHFRQDKDS
jgi:hypothetical protein